MSSLNVICYIVVVVSLFSCATPQEKARNYNNEVVLILTEAGVAMNRLDEALLNQNSVNMYFDQAKKKADSCLFALNEIGLYEEDTTLIHPAKRIINIYNKLLSRQYVDLVQFHTLPAEKITFDVVDSTRVLRMEIQNESTFVQRDFENAQQSFADRYTLKLVE